VITARRTSTGVVFAGALPPGASAFVDADWIPDEAAQAVPAMRPPPSADPARAAAAALESVAQRVREAVRADAPVEVDGRGAIAERVRALVGAGPAGSAKARPSTCVVAGAGSEALLAATRHVADLGTVVVVAESPGLALDLYPDLHLRSLTMIGIAPPAAEGLAGAADWPIGIPPPRDAVLGQEVPEAPWYRVRADER
jgi:hypothetical protein